MGDRAYSKRAVLVATSVLLALSYGCLESEGEAGIRAAVNQLSSNDYREAEKAMRTLVANGEKSIPYLRPKLHTLRKNVTMRTIHVIVQIGTPGIEALREEYRAAEEDSVRVTLGLSLAEATADKSLLPELSQFLTSPERLARTKIAFDLGLLMQRYAPPNTTLEEGAQLKQEFAEWWKEHAHALGWSPVEKRFVYK